MGLDAAGSGEISGGYLTDHLSQIKRDGYSRTVFALKFWQTFKHFFPADRAARILEIGPGECELVEYLREKEGFSNVEVVDIEEEVVILARSLGFHASLTADVIEFLEHSSDRYSLIIMSHVLEHIPKSKTIATLSAARKALMRQGCLLIAVPNMGDPLNGTAIRYADFTHEVGFTEESLAYVGRRAGYDSYEFIISVRAVGRTARVLQKLSQRILHGLLFLVNLPNGRQMQRNISPELTAIFRRS